MAFNAFLKLADVDGEATQKGFEKWIALDSFSFGASNQMEPTGTGGMSSGKVNVSHFNISKPTDNSSLKIFQHCCSGKHFPDARVAICKAGGEQEKYLEYVFDTVAIADINWSGGGGDERPQENASLAFGKVTIEYRPQSLDGKLGSPIMAYYDLISATTG
jgi:type VI secretion system Hcp family effector